MTRKTTTLDDIAESIFDLGTLVSNQITELRHELLGEIIGVRDSLSDEICDVRHGLASVKREVNGLRLTQSETNRRLLALEDEAQATRADIKELYDLHAA